MGNTSCAKADTDLSCAKQAAAINTTNARNNRRVFFILTSSFLIRLQHDLAKHLALFHALVGGARFAQRESRVDDTLQAPGKDVTQNLVQLAHRAHVRTEERQLTCKENPDVE